MSSQTPYDNIMIKREVIVSTHYNPTLQGARETYVRHSALEWLTIWQRP